MVIKRSSAQTKDTLILCLDLSLLVGLVTILVGLPFHLVIKKLIPGALGIYWKEILLGVLVILWLIGSFLSHRPLLMRNRLEGAVLIYVALIVLRLFIDRSGLVGLWGLYISIMYLPLFWLVPVVLQQRPSWVMKLLILLSGVGALLALGGLLEFVLDRTLWPSDEIFQRQGFADMYVYATNLRRVYFVLDSPTTLANTLAILLPLSLVLTMITENKWGRLTAVLSSLLMIACIVVTFSRGIWVAMAVALLIMGFLDGYVHKYGRALLVSLGVFLMAVMVWGGVMLLRTSDAPSETRSVVELSAQSYQTVPVVIIYEELINNEPETGEFKTQTWTIYDPNARQDDTRLVFYEHPPESGRVEVIFRVEMPEACAVRFAIALSPEVWSPEKGDGATFSVFIAPTDNSEEGEFIFSRYINPKSNPNDRRWRNFLVDLSSWAGSTVNISLITEAGPSGDYVYDWAGWSDLQIVSLPDDYFTNTQKENAVLEHTSSILDWAQDETNRDRLNAWSLSLSAWQTNPIFGTGLGSTGVAALRTHPESAFVTESQILKALTEHGLPGIIVLVYLWFQIGYIGFHTYRAETDFKKRLMLVGILTSLLVVFIEGWVYQNLEVKQVNAYFWTLVGLLAFFTRGLDE